MKKFFVLVCLVLLLGNLIFSPPSFKANIEAGISNLYLEIPKNAWSRAPVKTVYLPVKLGNLSLDGDALVKSIEILDKDNNLIFEEKKEISLKSVYEFAKSEEEIRESLGINPPTTEDLNKAKDIILEIDKETDKTKKDILVEEAWQLLQYKHSDKNPDTYTEKEQQLSNLLYTEWFEIDLTKIKKNIEEEDYIPIKVKINYEINSAAYQAEEQTYLFYLNSLPTRTGWYPGDGHIHTTWSDGDSTVMQRRDQAESKGLKWAIITDHAGDNSHPTFPPWQPRFEESEWAAYRLDCGNALNKFPYITVCPGEELATSEIAGSHYLAYSTNSYVPSFLSRQELINRTNSANGFGVIAHPYNPAFAWSDWSVIGFSGLEIISNQEDYSQSAVNKWDELLTINLQGIIGGGRKIIGMANSDVHNSAADPWCSNMNYIYTGSSNPPGTDRSAVYNNLKAGKVSASSDGSLAVFSLNNYTPGSIVNVNPGYNNVSITISGKCMLSNSNNITIKIKTNNGSELLSDSFYDSDTDFTKTYIFTANYDCYYRVEVTFKDSAGNPTSYCFVNPIFVNLP